MPINPDRLAADGTACPKCGYELRASIEAGSDKCPECGAVYVLCIRDESTLGWQYWQQITRVALLALCLGYNSLPVIYEWLNLVFGYGPFWDFFERTLFLSVFGVSVSMLGLVLVFGRIASRSRNILLNTLTVIFCLADVVFVSWWCYVY